MSDHHFNPPEQTCSGKFSDARDCPVHGKLRVERDRIFREAQANAIDHLQAEALKLRRSAFRIGDIVELCGRTAVVVSRPTDDTVEVEPCAWKRKWNHGSERWWVGNLTVVESIDRVLREKLALEVAQRRLERPRAVNVPGPGELCVFPPPATSDLTLVASGMRKLLPPALLNEVIAHLDPLRTFCAALREAAGAAQVSR